MTFYAIYSQRITCFTRVIRVHLGNNKLIIFVIFLLDFVGELAREYLGYGNEKPH